jgi:cobalt/nickel transport system permease protein
MHIPDGYLSPATCAAMYAAATPFWYASLQRVKKSFSSRMVPLLSLFAAFSFVIMMFNLPLPGGTTGHAVGVGIAAIVLGPWASMLAISVALVIQAVFFGDGGITALGANCFNMAIVGSLSAYVVYRAIAARAALSSKRRVVAAAIAGYVAINLSALLAAMEFGIQPWLFHDSSGAPLYAPYPLNVTIPAMMIGHLTVAGMAELVLSAGVVSYLQRTDTSLLQFTAPELAVEAAAVGPIRAERATRSLWAALAFLLLLTPLGVLAVGTAWGEWSVRDLEDARARQQIAAAARNQELPAQTPSGLQKLSGVWTAPFPNYAPGLVKSRHFGYLLSAMFGTGLTILVVFAGSRFTSRLGRSGARDGESRIH